MQRNRQHCVDLELLSGQILGEQYAERPGHSLNAAVFQLVNRLAQWRLEQEGDLYAVQARWRCAPIAARVWHECGAAHPAKQIAELPAARAAIGKQQLEE